MVFKNECLHNGVIGALKPVIHDFRIISNTLASGGWNANHLHLASDR